MSNQGSAITTEHGTCVPVKTINGSQNSVQRSAVIRMYFAVRVQRSVVIGMYFAVQCTALCGHRNVHRRTVYSVLRCIIDVHEKTVQCSAVIGMYIAVRVQRSAVYHRCTRKHCTVLRGHRNVLRRTVYCVLRCIIDVHKNLCTALRGHRNVHRCTVYSVQRQ